MKTIEDYLRMNYTMEVIEDPTEGGFVVSFPELPGCLTCGQTLENALANALDAKKAWLEAALEDGEYYELLEHCLGSLEQVKSKGWSRTEPAPIL